MSEFLKRYLLYILYALMIVVETIIWLACGTIAPYLPILLAIFALLGICSICFTYELSKLDNKWHARWNVKRHKTMGDENYEPSGLMILRSKIAGYVLIIMYQVVFCLFLF